MVVIAGIGGNQNQNQFQNQNYLRLQSDAVTSGFQRLAIGGGGGGGGGGGNNAAPIPVAIGNSMPSSPRGLLQSSRNNNNSNNNSFENSNSNLLLLKPPRTPSTPGGGGDGEQQQKQQQFQPNGSVLLNIPRFGYYHKNNLSFDEVENRSTRQIPTRTLPLGAAKYLSEMRQDFQNYQQRFWGNSPQQPKHHRASPSTTDGSSMSTKQRGRGGEKGEDEEAMNISTVRWRIPVERLETAPNYNNNNNRSQQQQQDIDDSFSSSSTSSVSSSSSSASDLSEDEDEEDEDFDGDERKAIAAAKKKHSATVIKKQRRKLLLEETRVQWPMSVASEWASAKQSREQAAIEKAELEARRRMEEEYETKNAELEHARLRVELDFLEEAVVGIPKKLIEQRDQHEEILKEREVRKPVETGLYAWPTTRAKRMMEDTEIDDVRRKLAEIEAKKASRRKKATELRKKMPPPTYFQLPGEPPAWPTQLAEFELKGGKRRYASRPNPASNRGPIPVGGAQDALSVQSWQVNVPVDPSR